MIIRNSKILITTTICICFLCKLLLKKYFANALVGGLSSKAAEEKGDYSAILQLIKDNISKMLSNKKQFQKWVFSQTIVGNSVIKIRRKGVQEPEILPRGNSFLLSA